MTRIDRIAIARYLRDAADDLRASHYDHRTRRPEPKSIRDEIAQLRKWAKMLRQEKRE